MSKYFLLFFLIHTISFSQSIDSQIKDVERLGNYLFQYKQACRNAYDTLIAAKVSLSTVNSCYTYKDKYGWKVAFGRYGEASDEYLISYEIDYNPQTGLSAIRSFDTPFRDKSFYCHAAKMERVVSKFLDPANKPYNFVVIPFDSSSWYVYAFPDQIDSTLYRLGGDTRFTVDWRNDQVKEIHRLHKSIILMPFNSCKYKGTISSALISSTPVESDILYVLLRNFKSVHKVVTKENIFVINDKGEITRSSLNKDN